MPDKEVAWLLAEKYNGEKTEDFFADCARLALGEPLAYIIGHIPFLGTTIYLDSRPLIPRTETEYWVEKTLSYLQDFPIPPQVLDLCAGSGCIGTAIGHHIAKALVDFAEYDPIHRDTITKNAVAAKLDGRYQVYIGDLFSAVPPGSQYHAIYSNPPYIDPALDRTTPSVKNYEPHVALYAEKNGLALINRIIEEAPNYLYPQGTLYIEHEPEQAAAIATLGDSHFIIHTQQDQYGLARCSTLVLR